MKSKRSIQEEVRRLRKLEKNAMHEGVRIQANMAALALEWAIGKYGMPWSKWIRSCDKVEKSFEKAIYN